MSLFGLTEIVPEDYIIILINSAFISHYVDNYVNNTQTFQINDARQLPIIIPSFEMNEIAKRILKEAIRLKTSGADNLLMVLQKEVDKFVSDVYHC